MRALPKRTTSTTVSSPKPRSTRAIDSVTVNALSTKEVIST